jgi:hypothetical protein
MFIKSDSPPAEPAANHINPFVAPPGPYGTPEKSWISLYQLGYSPALVDVRTKTKANASTPQEHVAPMVRHNGLCLVKVLDVETFSKLLEDPAWNCVPIFASADVAKSTCNGTFVFKSFGNLERTIGQLEVSSAAPVVPAFESFEKFVTFPPTEDGLCQWISPPAVHKGWLRSVPIALASELASLAA